MYAEGCGRSRRWIGADGNTANPGATKDLPPALFFGRKLQDCLQGIAFLDAFGQVFALMLQREFYLLAPRDIAERNHECGFAFILDGGSGDQEPEAVLARKLHPDFHVLHKPSF